MLFFFKGVGQKPQCIPDPEKAGVLTEKHFPPRFSVQVYLICLSVIMFISFIAFLLLWRQQRKDKRKKQDEQKRIEENLKLTVNTEQNVPAPKPIVKEEKFDANMQIYLFVTLWTSILLIGCIPSINSYSLNPYGAATFHYVLILCRRIFLFSIGFSSFSV